MMAHSLVLVHDQAAELQAANKAATRHISYKRKQIQCERTLNLSEGVWLTILKEFNARIDEKKAKKREWVNGKSNKLARKVSAIIKYAHLSPLVSSTVSSQSILSDTVPFQEPNDKRSNLYSMAFDCEMTSIKQMHLSLGQIPFERVRPRSHKNRVILAPNRQ